MELSELFEAPVYGFERGEKTIYMLEGLNRLTRHHYAQCPSYAKIMDAFESTLDADALEKVPMLPVRLFKHFELKSISDALVIKTLTSSGTTSQQVSRIYLDKETSVNQTKALVKIMQNFLGKKRLPMLIADTSAILKDRKLFSARGAGILGLSNFGRDHTYLLDDTMQINLSELDAFLSRHHEGPVLMFGFTFMIWQHFYAQLATLQKKFDLSRVILIHSGGWKKLQDLAVDNDTFKKKLRDLCGIERIHNFYGMVEQVGSIFVECEAGYLHTPSTADLIIRDPHSFEPLPYGEEGVIQVLSLLPASYPGHSLMTEDLGTIHGEDDCRCGRKGKYFSVKGRLPKAELRGCSDTYADQGGGQ